MANDFWSLKLALWAAIGMVFAGCETAEAALTVNPSDAGNVFYTTETIKVPVAASVGTSVKWAVTDYFGNAVSTGAVAVSSGATTIQPTTNGEIGFFTLAISEMTGATVNSTGTTTFTIIKTPPSQTNSPYGTQTHFADDLPEVTPPLIAPILAKGGITQIRDELQWEAVENPQGTFSWPPNYTAYMSAAATNTLTPLITLDFANQFYDYSGGPFTGQTTATGLAGFANYGLQVPNQFHSQVSDVEVWDEYNGSFLAGTATADPQLYYYDLLQSIYKTVKPAYPNVQVVGFAAYPIADGFMQEVLSNGSGSTAGNNYVDIFSVHPYYNEPEGVDLQFDQMSSLIASFNNGVAKPIWATEFSLGGTTKAEYLQESSYLPRIIAEMQTAGVAKMFYYTVQDDAATPFRGLVGAPAAQAQSGLLGDYLANPVFASYSNLISQLYGWTETGRISAGLAQTTFVYGFQNGANHKYVCWGGEGFNGAPTTLTMTIGSATATVSDVMGNVTPLTASGGTITVPVAGVNPVYVTVTGGSASAVAEAANPVVADSVAGFSGTQGQGGWSYGTISGSYNEANFTPLPWNIWSTDEYRWTPAGGPAFQSYPFMMNDQQHPVSGSCVVRRWTSTVSGMANISGTIIGPKNTDGVICVIYVNGNAVATFPASQVVNQAVVTYSVPGVTLSKGSVVDFVENVNTVMSSDATGWVTRITTGASPVVSTPLSQVVTVGAPATFSVTATGSAPLTYQWLYNNSVISGAIGSSYTIPSVAAANDGKYSVAVSNSFNTVTSGTATLIAVASQPVAQVVNSGQAATFSVSVAGSGSYTYQWLFNGATISGATNSSYTVSNVTLATAGTYSVTITGPNGAVTTTPVSLTVIVATDTPTMPQWALLTLAVLLVLAATLTTTSSKEPGA